MASCDTTLPTSWYTSKSIYGLERRAIFLRSWSLLGAVTKFPDTRINYSHELAQIHFRVRRETPDWRSIKVYNEADGSEMRSHLTGTGLLFLTLSEETVSFEEFFPGLESLIAHEDFTRYSLRRPLSYTSRNNWKAAVDAYQECLHCAYAHPEFAKTYKPEVYRVEPKHNYSQHFAMPGQCTDGLFFHLFPNCTLSLYAGGLTCWRINPSEDPAESRMEFDYYHEAAAGTEEFEEWFRFTRNVALEDLELCEKVQQNFNVGIYVDGLLNPTRENGVASFHKQVLNMCSDQFDKEKVQPQPLSPGVMQPLLANVTA